MSRQKIGSWETFTIIYLDNSLVAFKACNGKYLSVNEKYFVSASSLSIGDNEKFKIIDCK